MEKINIKEKNKIIESRQDLKNYEVITQTYNPLIEDVINASRFEIQPFFQRHYVWDQQQKSNLFDTIFTGMPLPAIYTYMDHNTSKEVVIDGQQRLITIKKFMNNEFKLKNLQNNSFLNGFDFFSLPTEYKSKILNYALTIVKIVNVNDESIIFDIFQKYNTGGVKLNKQEIRNCINSGKYNDLIIELSQYKPFVSLFKIKEIDRMEKEEYVLRFLALHQDFDKYNGNINKFLEEHLESKKQLDNLSSDLFDIETSLIKKIFKKSIDASIEVFGINTFKNCLNFKSKQIMYKLMSKPVFDMQMLGFADFDLDLIVRHKVQIKKCYEEIVLKNEEMSPHYKKMSRKSVAYRISKWKKEIAEIIKNP